jgi:hypothetical protein
LQYSNKQKRKEKMGKLFGKNWKTTTAGILAGIVTVTPQIQAGLAGQNVNWGNIAIGALIAILGAVSKDANVSNAPSPGPPKNTP